MDHHSLQGSGFETALYQSCAVEGAIDRARRAKVNFQVVTCVNERNTADPDNSLMDGLTAHLLGRAWRNYARDAAAPLDAEAFFEWLSELHPDVADAVSRVPHCTVQGYLQGLRAASEPANRCIT